MNMYNLLFGRNPNADILLAIIGLKRHEVERFRDCHMLQDEKQIVVYTRTGGGNRHDYPNARLTQSPLYLHDEDDDFDSTYASYYFKFPPGLEQECADFADVSNRGLSPKFIQHVLAVIERPATPEDTEARNYEEQTREFGRIPLTEVMIFNGHTLVPVTLSAEPSTCCPSFRSTRSCTTIGLACPIKS